MFEEEENESIPGDITINDKKPLSSEKMPPEESPPVSPPPSSFDKTSFEKDVEQEEPNPLTEPKNRKIPWKIIIVIGLLAIIGGGFSLVYFTDLKYKLPFFQAEESELVGMMYERMKEFKGADFAINFSVNVGEKTNSFSHSGNDSNLLFDLIPPVYAVTSYSIEAIGTTISNSPTANLNSNSNTNTDSSDLLSFFSGESLNDYWEYLGMWLSDDFEVDLTFSGSGLTLSGTEGKKTLPNLEAAVKGNLKMGSTSMLIDMTAKVVDESVYYKVSEFPYIDITQGHKGEWIKASSSDVSINEYTARYEELGDDQVNNIIKFISTTKEKKLLVFKQTGKKAKIEGIEAPEFEVEINAEVVPEWLESLQSTLNTNSGTSIVNTGSDELTDEDKSKLKERIERAMDNIKITVALHPGTGDLMKFSLASRIVPPDEVEIYKNKQINMGLSLTMWNHNKSPNISVPSGYVDWEEIERERLGLSKEAYQDRKQAERVLSIQAKLTEYWQENKKYPDKLENITRTNKDLNTGKTYPYTAESNNYTLEYFMNDVEQEPSTDESSDSSIIGLGFGSVGKKGIGRSKIGNKINEWQKGKNVADRFSPISDQTKKTTDFINNAEGKNDHDVLAVVNQSNTVHTAKAALNSYKAKFEKYPDDITALEEAIKNKEIYSYNISDGYICEDLVTGKICEYEVGDGGYSYEFKINYNLGKEQLTAEALAAVRYDVKEFKSGKNVFTQITSSYTSVSDPSTASNTDTDKDGLTDAVETYLGSNKYKEDSDDDGYNDKTEYYGGYNMLGSGESTIGSWSDCIDFEELPNCKEYCQSIGKLCTTYKAVDSAGSFGKPIEAWSNEDDCLNKKVTGISYSTCNISSYPANMKIWRCFCK